MAIEDRARAQRITALRKRKRLTQQAIVEKLGVAYRTYQTWESLKEPVMPDWPNLERLAKFHGVKPEDIIGETPDVAALMGDPAGQSQFDRLEETLGRVEQNQLAIADQVAAILTLTQAVQAVTQTLIAPSEEKPRARNRSRRAG